MFVANDLKLPWRRRKREGQELQTMQPAIFPPWSPPTIATQNENERQAHFPFQWKFLGIKHTRKGRKGTKLAKNIILHEAFHIPRFQSKIHCHLIICNHDTILPFSAHPCRNRDGNMNPCTHWLFAYFHVPNNHY